MAATDSIWARSPLRDSDIPYKNTSGAAITAGQTLKLDAAHPVSTAQPIVGCVPTSAVSDVPYCVAVDNCPAGANGRGQIEGLALCIADGAVTAGAVVGASAAVAGDVTPYTAANPSLGTAENTTTTAGDPLLVRIAVSINH